MLFGPIESSELSFIVMPAEPSAPVLTTSAVSRRRPTVPATDWPPRSTETWPLATFICPISAAHAGAAESAARAVAAEKARGASLLCIQVSFVNGRQSGDARYDMPPRRCRVAAVVRAGDVIRAAVRA